MIQLHASDFVCWWRAYLKSHLDAYSASITILAIRETLFIIFGRSQLEISYRMRNF